MTYMEPSEIRGAKKETAYAKGCEEYEMCELTNYEKKYKDLYTKFFVPFWVMAAVGIIAFGILVCSLYHHCCKFDYSATLDEREERKKTNPDLIFKGSASWGKDTNATLANMDDSPEKKAMVESFKRMQEQENLKVIIENRYSDGPELLYDKREVIVPRVEIVNMEGIVDVARVHERFGSPMAEGFDRRTFTQGVVEVKAPRYEISPPASLLSFNV